VAKAEKEEKKRKEEESGVKEEKKKKKRHRLTVRNIEKNLYIYTGRNWPELNDLSFLFSFLFIPKLLS
jgi:hypothetical protein